MRRTAKKEFYEWRDYEADVLRLARELVQSNRKIKNVFGIPRGGLIPAVSLSHLLGRPLISDAAKISSATLVVDDIVESGATLKRLMALTKGKKPLIASLYYYPKASVRPDIYLRKKQKWVVFPWETEKTSRYDFTL